MPRRWPKLRTLQAGPVIESIQAACNRPASVREVFLLFLLTLAILWSRQRADVAVYIPDARPGHVII
ncbi:MAG: hypothetical protein JWM36_4428 [Hyphomicrobiales bacterium]|nr:hypothetical protein [Hyphomicrobiales bacterium]